MPRSPLCVGIFALIASCGFPKPQDLPGDASAGDAVEVMDATEVKSCVRTTCTADILEVCDATGTVTHTERCALGCTAQDRCNQLAPSNGLSQFVDGAAQLAAINLPSGSVIDTDTGTVTAAGTPLAVTTATIAQPGGAALRVLVAQTWTIGDLRIRGSLPIALVAADAINLQGVIDVSADASSSGAGAWPCGNGDGGSAEGFFQRCSSPGYPTFVFAANGAGGGGFGTEGGKGGIRNGGIQVGAAGLVNGNTELVPLRGGCQGGGRDPVHRGAGGGAIQLVSGRSVHLVKTTTGTGIVHVGGGRGIAGALGKVSETDTTPVYGAGGGGSGGAVLIEAPSVVFDNGTALLAAGGGGGGFGACTPPPDGSDALPDARVASGGDCPAGVVLLAVGGGGGTTGAGGNGQDKASPICGSAGSGGGGLGRIRINTADGQYAGAGALLRGVVTTGVVGRR